MVDNNYIEFMDYKGIREFISIEPAEVNKKFFNDAINHHVSGGRSRLIWWFGAETIDEVKRICREGWKEGLEICSDIKRNLPEIGIIGDFHKKYKRKKKWSDSGDEIDVDKYIHQEYETMYIDHEKAIQDKEGKIITIYASLGFRQDVSSRESIWSGITASVLTDIFESVGYRVNLVSFRSGIGSFKSYSSPQKCQFNINIKLPEQPLDLLNILTATAFAGFYRYYGFKAIAAFKYETSYGFGRSQANPFIFEKNSFVIGNIWNSRDAYLKILQVLNFVKERGYSCH